MIQRAEVLMRKIDDCCSCESFENETLKIKVFFSGVLSLQERKFEGGSGQISECMALELGERVKLESPVYSIDQTGQMVLVKTLDNQTYSVRLPGCSPSLTDVLRTESQHLMSGKYQLWGIFFFNLQSTENIRKPHIVNIQHLFRNVSLLMPNCFFLKKSNLIVGKQHN